MSAMLRVDFAKCIKAGECYYNHPELFAMTENGFPQQKVREPASAGEVKGATDAVQVCPSGAISYGDN